MLQQQNKTRVDSERGCWRLEGDGSDTGMAGVGSPTCTVRARSSRFCADAFLAADPYPICIARAASRHVHIRPVYPRQSNPRRSKPERCTRAYYGLDDFYAARQASRFRPGTA